MIQGDRKRLQGVLKRFRGSDNFTANGSNNAIVSAPGGGLLLTPYVITLSASGVTNARVRLYFHDGSAEVGDILGDSSNLVNVGLNFMIGGTFLPIAKARADDWAIGAAIIYDSGAQTVSINVAGLKLHKLEG